MNWLSGWLINFGVTDPMFLIRTVLIIAVFLVVVMIHSYVLRLHRYNRHLCERIDDLVYQVDKLETEVGMLKGIHPDAEEK